MYIGHLWEPVIEKKVRNSILTLNKKHPVYLLTEHSFMNMNIPWKVHRHNINIPNHPGSVSFPMFNNAAFDRMYCSYWHGALFPRQLNSKTQRLQTTLMDPSLGVMDGCSWPMTRWDYVMWPHVMWSTLPIHDAERRVHSSERQKQILMVEVKDIFIDASIMWYLNWNLK